ncbi:MAG: DUF309 domain-containing protein [Thermaerobacter sp.]|nr:DUF309 domain-containing protein [Thermaerobacter sp.]
MDDWARFLDAMRQTRYFEAHDCLEPRWRDTRSPRVQAAIWLAVLLLHQTRGNAVGTDRVQTKLRHRLRDLAAPQPLQVVAAGVPVNGPAVCRALTEARDWVLGDGPDGRPGQQSA